VFLHDVHSCSDVAIFSATRDLTAGLPCGLLQPEDRLMRWKERRRRPAAEWPAWSVPASAVSRLPSMAGEYDCETSTPITACSSLEQPADPGHRCPLPVQHTTTYSDPDLHISMSPAVTLRTSPGSCVCRKSLRSNLSSAPRPVTPPPCSASLRQPSLCSSSPPA
jgi:hypothetical protein